MERAEKVCEEEGSGRYAKRSNWAMNLKVAIENLRVHPKRVVDVESLLEVKGVGPKMAHVVSSTLFALYPPDASECGEVCVAPARAGARTKQVQEAKQAGQGTCSKKEYTPALGTANYAFLIVLYREQHVQNSREFMTKDELMHAAEASCLAHKPIFSEGSVSQAQPGSRYTRSFYNGWSSFKSLVNHNLAHAWGNPKKISLTSKGVDVAARLYNDAIARGKIDNDARLDGDYIRFQEERNDDRDDLDVGVSSLRARLEQRLVNKVDTLSTSSLCDVAQQKVPSSQPQNSSLVARDYNANASTFSSRSLSCTAMPPLSHGKRFSDEYDVILLIDERERYFDTGSSGHRLDVHLDRIRQQGVLVEVKTLPIGDALWIARQKSNPREEYVLDYIIERKGLEDLISSVKESGRYHSQKYRLQHCGLQNIYYLVEGEVEALSSSADYKLVCTVCAKSSALDGFNILRTRSVTETLRLYKRMTTSITKFYNSRSGSSTRAKSMALSTFESQCKEFDKNAIKLQDIWAIMLNEVPRLGPQASIAIAHAYPTPVSLRQALKRRRDDSMLAHIPLKKSTTGRQATVGPCKSKSVIDTFFFF